MYLLRLAEFIGLLIGRSPQQIGPYLHEAGPTTTQLAEDIYSLKLLLDRSLATRKLDYRPSPRDARAVRTKYRKTFTTWLFPIGDDLEAIVANWMDTLTSAGYGPTDPLFPSTKTELDENRLLKATGLTHQHWKDAGAIRRIFKEAFQRAGLTYFNPHSFRHTRARLGETLCTTPEQFKAWSQNLDHENVLTTFTNYGNVEPIDRQRLYAGLARREADRQSPSATRQTGNLRLCW